MWSATLDGLDLSFPMPHVSPYPEIVTSRLAISPAKDLHLRKFVRS
ncbi:hypothetical protein L1274_003028 [Duganella sp. HSC-15S17]|uniref:Uncharacterized protein n=1 Tax=Duganella violaceipulchra TaxID=2849652 RepID=A0ABT1GK30_9BURK|nr:hypothetical protein [Duganella violaceicalia]